MDNISLRVNSSKIKNKNNLYFRILNLREEQIWRLQFMN